MKIRSLARGTALVAVAALVVAYPVLTAPSATAAPVFTDATTRLDSYFAPGTSGTGCTVTGGGPVQQVPVPENGPPTVVSKSYVGTFGNSGNAGDTATALAAVTGTAALSSSAGSLRSIDLAVQSSSRLDSALGVSTCQRYYEAGLMLVFEFTVARAGFLTLELDTQGATFGRVEIARTSSGAPPLYVANSGEGDVADNRSRVLLAPGTYEGSFGATTSHFNEETSTSRSGSVTAHGEFVLTGAQTAAASGKGRLYVTMPAERTCSTQSLAPSITGKGRRARAITSVVFRVNGAKVRKVSSPGKGRVIDLPVEARSAATLLAVVTLDPRKPGRPARVVEVTAGYEACS